MVAAPYGQIARSKPGPSGSIRANFWQVARLPLYKRCGPSTYQRRSGASLRISVQLVTVRLHESSSCRKIDHQDVQ
jgi:hypothetical protein